MPTDVAGIVADISTTFSAIVPTASFQLFIYFIFIVGAGFWLYRRSLKTTQAQTQPIVLIAQSRHFETIKNRFVQKNVL